MNIPEFFTPLLLLGALLCCGAASARQYAGTKEKTYNRTFERGETASPTMDAEVERVVSTAEVNNEIFSNVTVILKSASSGKGVKVKVVSASGKSIYKNNFSKAYLYGFSDGQLQVANGEVQTLVRIFKDGGEWQLLLKERGIY